MVLNEELERLKNRVYITMSARFEAYRRMKRRKISSTVSLALLSLSIIGYNILQLCTGFEKYNEVITAVTIMLSVFVLALSLLVSYLNYSEKEHKYYECGLKLSTLYDKITLHATPSTPLEVVEKFFNEYDHILGECGVNHINIDNLRARVRIKKEEYDRCDRVWIWLYWHLFDVNTLYWVLAFGIPWLTGIIIFCPINSGNPICQCGCQ